MYEWTVVSVCRERWAWDKGGWHKPIVTTIVAACIHSVMEYCKYNVPEGYVTRSVKRGALV